MREKFYNVSLFCSQNIASARAKKRWRLGIVEPSGPQCAPLWSTLQGKLPNKKSPFILKTVSSEVQTFSRLAEVRYEWRARERNQNRNKRALLCTGQSAPFVLPSIKSPVFLLICVLPQSHFCVGILEIRDRRITRNMLSVDARPPCLQGHFWACYWLNTHFAARTGKCKKHKVRY